jgi:two-component system OmpR family response regulator
MAKDQLILIVDDDANLREIVRFALEKEGYASVQAADGKQALAVFAERQPTLVILDIMMPEMDGTEVCRQIRKTSELPIVFLSSKDDELDRILGLELGGDDYITKPFSPRELAARVKSILRRAAARSAAAQAAAQPRAAPPAGADAAADCMRHGELRLDLTTFKGYWQDREVVLTAMEFGLLKALMSHPRKVFTRDELMTRAYDDNTVVSDRTIDSHVRRIRRKFSQVGLDPIETVTGFGYKMASAR